VVHGPKPPLHRYNWLSFSKFQDTEHILIPCPRHVSSRLPHSGETCKYATASSTQKTWRDSVLIDMLLSAVSVLVSVQPGSEVPEGLMNYPVCSSHVEWLVSYLIKHKMDNFTTCRIFLASLSCLIWELYGQFMWLTGCWGAGWGGPHSRSLVTPRPSPPSAVQTTSSGITILVTK
jgi:hypothetical protein